MKLLRFAEPVWVTGYRTGSVLARSTIASLISDLRRSNAAWAVSELELPNFAGWDLIRRFTFQKPLKIIATTSAYPESLFEKIKGIGVDAVVPKAIASEVWLKTVEKVLQVNEGTTAETR